MFDCSSATSHKIKRYSKPQFLLSLYINIIYANYFFLEHNKMQNIQQNVLFLLNGYFNLSGTPVSHPADLYSLIMKKLSLPCSAAGFQQKIKKQRRHFHFALSIEF